MKVPARCACALRCAGAVLLTAVISAAPAGAHARLLSSDPTGGATLLQAPTRVRLMLSEPIETSGATLSADIPKFQNRPPSFRARSRHTCGGSDSDPRAALYSPTTSHSRAGQPISDDLAPLTAARAPSH